MQLIPNLRFIFFFGWMLCVASFSSTTAWTREFKVRLSSQPQTLNWNSATTGSESAIILNIMEGLFETNQNQLPIPRLASRFRWSKDGTQLVIKIRKGIAWTDGKPLLAKHFVDSFENLLSPAVNSPNASLLFDLVSAKDFFMGKVKNFDQVGVRATQSHQLTLTFQEPRNNFIPVLTHWATFPLRKDRPELTLGPYRLTGMNPIALEKNTRYFGVKPQLEKVIFEVIPDGKRALKLYENRELDYLLQTEAETHPEVSFAEPVRVIALLHLNPLRSRTNSPEVRRAVMKEINLNRILLTHPGSRLPAPQLLPLLKVASKDKTKDLPTASLSEGSLSLGYPNDDLSKSVATAIQESTQSLKIKIEPLPAAQGAAKKYDLILSFFGLDFAEPDQFFSAFLPQGSLDLFGVSYPEINDLIHKARFSPKAEVRNALYLDAADFLQNKISIVMPLFYRRRAFLLSPKFVHENGFRGSPQIIKIHSKKS